FPPSRSPPPPKPPLFPYTTLFRSHLGQDEILLLQTGTAHVWLGEQERDVHAGGLVFIPAHTWISLKNTGTEPVSLTFIFSAPGLDRKSTRLNSSHRTISYAVFCLK